VITERMGVKKEIFENMRDLPEFTTWEGRKFMLRGGNRAVEGHRGSSEEV